MRLIRRNSAKELDEKPPLPPPSQQQQPKLRSTNVDLSKVKQTESSAKQSKKEEFVTVEHPRFVGATPPHILAYEGRFDELQAVIEENPYIALETFNYNGNTPLLTRQEENDEMFVPPPLVPKNIRSALAVGDVRRMTREERWVLAKGFQDSSLLHYACAGNRFRIVKYLIEVVGVDRHVLNSNHKPAEFYSNNDAILEYIWSRDHQQQHSAGRSDANRAKTKSGRILRPRASEYLEKLRVQLVNANQNADDLSNTQDDDNSSQGGGIVFKSKVPFADTQRPFSNVEEETASRRSSFADSQSGTNSRRLSKRRLSRVLSTKRMQENESASASRRPSEDSIQGVSVPPIVTSSRTRAPPPPPPLPDAEVAPLDRKNDEKENLLEEIEKPLVTSLLDELEKPSVQAIKEHNWIGIAEGEEERKTSAAAAAAVVSSSASVPLPPGRRVPPPPPSSSLPPPNVTSSTAAPPPPPRPPAPAAVAPPPPTTIVHVVSDHFHHSTFPPPPPPPSMTRPKPPSLRNEHGLEQLQEDHGMETMPLRRSTYRSNKDVVDDAFEAALQLAIEDAKARNDRIQSEEKESQHIHQLERAADILKRFRPIEHLANTLLSENSESQEHVYRRAQRNVRLLMQQQQQHSQKMKLARFPGEGGGAFSDKWSDAGDSVITTITAPSLSSYLPSTQERFKSNVSCESVTFLEMIWQNAAKKMNRGVFDTPAEHANSRLAREFHALRQEAYREGVRLLRREFKSYAQKETWEGIELLRMKALTTMIELRRRLRAAQRAEKLGLMAASSNGPPESPVTSPFSRSLRKSVSFATTSHSHKATASSALVVHGGGSRRKSVMDVLYAEGQRGKEEETKLSASNSSFRVGDFHGSKMSPNAQGIMTVQELSDEAPANEETWQVREEERLLRQAVRRLSTMDNDFDLEKELEALQRRMEMSELWGRK